MEHKGGMLVFPDTVKTSVEHVPNLARTFLEPPAIMVTPPICLPVVVVMVEGPVITKVSKSNRIYNALCSKNFQNVKLRLVFVEI